MTHWTSLTTLPPVKNARRAFDTNCLTSLRSLTPGGLDATRTVDAPDAGEGDRTRRRSTGRAPRRDHRHLKVRPEMLPGVRRPNPDRTVDMTARRSSSSNASELVGLLDRECLHDRDTVRVEVRGGGRSLSGPWSWTTSTSSRSTLEDEFVALVVEDGRAHDRPLVASRSRSGSSECHASRRLRRGSLRAHSAPDVATHGGVRRASSRRRP